MTLREELMDAWQGEGNGKRSPFLQWVREMADNPQGVLQYAASMYLNPVPRLTGEGLASALALTYQHYVDPDQPDSKVWCTDLGNGWIEIRGVFLNQLFCDQYLAMQQPILAARRVVVRQNGWEMFDRMRYSQARERIRHAAR